MPYLQYKGGNQICYIRKGVFLKSEEGVVLNLDGIILRGLKVIFFFFYVGTILAIEGIVALILLVHLEGNVAITIVKVRVAMSLVRGRMVLRNRILSGTHHQKRMKLYIKRRWYSLQQEGVWHSHYSTWLVFSFFIYKAL